MAEPKLIFPLIEGSYGLSATALALRRLAAAMGELGYATECLSIGDKASYRQLLASLAEPGGIYVTGPRLFEASVGGLTEMRPANLFQLFDKPVYGAIGDHPLAPFLGERLARTPAGTRFWCRCPSLQAELASLYPGHAAYAQVLSDTALRRAPPAPQPRDIDILVPLSLEKRTGTANHREAAHIAERLYPGAGKALDETAAVLRDDPRAQLYDVFIRAFARHTGTAFAEAGLSDQAAVQLRQCVSDTDFNQRLDRRWTALASVVEGARRLGRQVTVLQPDRLRPAGWGEVAAFVGAQDPDALESYFARSRVVLNVSPSYPDSVDERVLTAMLCGAAVLTDATPGQEALFRPDQDVAMFRQPEDAGSVLEDQAWPQQAAIAAAGQDLVRRQHSLDDLARNLAAIMRSHGDLA